MRKREEIAKEGLSPAMCEESATHVQPHLCNGSTDCQLTSREGQDEVDGTRYPWVSTFSYRGWCDLYQPKACDPTEDGYVGDYYWAICDAAPCTEVQDPSDPDRPLRCHCRIKDGPFVGTKDSCTGENGGIISAMELWVWDFENDTWSFPIAGYDYVKGACETLESHPFPR